MTDYSYFIGYARKGIPRPVNKHKKIAGVFSVFNSDSLSSQAKTKQRGTVLVFARAVVAGRSYERKDEHK